MLGPEGIYNPEGKITPTPASNVYPSTSMVDWLQKEAKVALAFTERNSSNHECFLGGSAFKMVQ